MLALCLGCSFVFPRRGKSGWGGRHSAEPKARLALCHQTDVMSELPTVICFPRFIYNAEYFLRKGKQRGDGGEKRAQVFLIKSLGRFRGSFTDSRHGELRLLWPRKVLWEETWSEAGRQYRPCTPYPAKPGNSSLWVLQTPPDFTG